MAEIKFNPYNFVPLGTKPDRSQGYPGRHQYRSGSYSGTLLCRLIALSPLVSVGQRRGEPWKPIKVFNFLRNSREEPIIQGTSLKGMVRSVYEAMCDGCLPLAGTQGGKSKPYAYQNLGAYRHEACSSLQNLCLACRLFGTTEGNKFHCEGRVRFNDAVLTKEKPVPGRRFLRELASPKPYHHATYGKGGISSGAIAGRKFYYHQGSSPSFSVDQTKSNDRSSAIDEFAPVGAEFSFNISVENLDAQELGRLLLAIELDEGLGHKIGMGKAIGLGSCKIVIDYLKSQLSSPTERYAHWADTTQSSAETCASFKPNWTTLPPGLIEILRLNKSQDGSIGYPSRPYPDQPIDARGVFGGTATMGGRPERPVQQGSGPTGVPPSVRQGEQAAWLKEIWEKELVLVTKEGKELRRSRKGYQGKENLLRVGNWFILSGTVAVKPVTP